jgi:hypothetical protein
MVEAPPEYTPVGWFAYKVMDPVLRKNIVLIYLILGTGQETREVMKRAPFQTVAEAAQEKVRPSRRMLIIR